MRAGAYSNAGAVRARRAVGVSNATGLREACATVNRFLRTRFPDGAWTSIAVLYNPCMGHRDIQNMPGHSNHALAGGDTGAGVDRRRRRGRPGWKTRRVAGSCEEVSAAGEVNLLLYDFVVQFVCQPVCLTMEVRTLREMA